MDVHADVDCPVLRNSAVGRVNLVRLMDAVGRYYAVGSPATRTDGGALVVVFLDLFDVARADVDLDGRRFTFDLIRRVSDVVVDLFRAEELESYGTALYDFVDV